MEKWQRTLSIMEENLSQKGMVKIADLKVYVLDFKGPLEEGWESKVAAFADQVHSRLTQKDQAADPASHEREPPRCPSSRPTDEYDPLAREGIIDGSGSLHLFRSI